MKSINAKKELLKTIKREGLAHNDGLGTIWSKKATDYISRLIENDIVNEVVINNDVEFEERNYKSELYIQNNCF